MTTKSEKNQTDTGNNTPSSNNSEQHNKHTRRKKRYREKGSGTIFLRGKRYYIKTMINRSIITKALSLDGIPCTTRKDAEKAAEPFRKYNMARERQDYINHVAEVRRLKRQYSLSIDSAWETYLQQPNLPRSEKTLLRYKRIFQTFMNWIVSKHPDIKYVSAIDEVIASEYMSWKKRDGISAVTYNTYCQILKLIFNRLRKAAELEKNPFDDIDKDDIAPVPRHVFTEEQLNMIFRGFKEGFFYDSKRGRKEFVPMYKNEMFVLLMMCLYIGCRGQDGCLMQWKDIDKPEGWITYVPRKTARKTGYKEYSAPIHPALRSALNIALQWKRKDDDYVLPNVAERYKHNPSGIQLDVEKIIKITTGLEPTLKKDELDGRQRKIGANIYGLHSFRHTHISLMGNQGASFHVVASMVGHTNPKMTEHYFHSSKDAKIKAINLLPNLMIRQPEDDFITDKNREKLKEIINSSLRSANREVLEKVIEFIRSVGLL